MRFKNIVLVLIIWGVFALILTTTTTTTAASSMIGEEFNFRGELKSQLEYEQVSQDMASSIQLNLKLEHYLSANGLVSAAIQLANNPNQMVNLKEAYIDFYLPATDLRIGKQRIVWGKVDGLNPTDNFNPEDLTEPFRDKEKINIPAIRAEHYYRDWIFDLVWAPGFTAPGLLESGDNWYPEGSIDIAEGFTMDYRPANNPETGLFNSEYGLRVERWSGGFDYSISYFNGWAKEPVFKAQLDLANQNLIIQPEYYRQQVLGADFSRASGKYVFRGEAAYFKPVADSGQKPLYQLVLGSDFDLTDKLYFNGQYFAEIMNTELLRNGLILALQYEFSTFTSLELNSIYEFKYHDLLLNPVLKKKLSDGFDLDLGVYLFSGDKGGELSPFTDKGFAYLEMRRYF